MIGAAVARLRAILIRGLAVAAVVFTYALGSVGTHVLGVVGISTAALTTTAAPAHAWWPIWRRRRWRRRRWRRWW
jgi:hypothetical protein